MAGRSDDSAIKALFSPSKGDPPAEKEKEKQITHPKMPPPHLTKRKDDPGPPHHWGARGVMVIVVGNEHGDTSSNPGRD